MLVSYKRYINESRGILYVSTILAFLLRLGYFFSFETMPIYKNGLLWNSFNFLFLNPSFSFVTAFLFTIGIAFHIRQLNERYALIRGRTSLPYVFSIFLLSCFPQFVFFSPAYIGIIFIIFCIDILFSSYQLKESSRYSFRIGFLLTLGSLFSSSLLVYIPVFWLGFFFMRSFNIKTFLAGLTGIGLIIWLEICYLYYQGEVKEFIYPLLYTWKSFNDISLFSLNIPYVIIFTISCIFIISTIIYNLTNSYKDKIQIRAYISFLNTLIILSLILYFFFIDAGTVQIVILSLSAIIFAHYFALTTNKRDVYLFIGFVIFYLSVYLYLLLESILN